MYNLIEYSDHYLKTSESLFQCYRDEPVLNNDGAVVVVLIILLMIYLNLNKFSLLFQ